LILDFLCLLTLIRVKREEFNFHLNLIFNDNRYIRLIILYINSLFSRVHPPLAK